jgi:hypothetical protein
MHSVTSLNCLFEVESKITSYDLINRKERSYVIDGIDTAAGRIPPHQCQHDIHRPWHRQGMKEQVIFREQRINVIEKRKRSQNGMNQRLVETTLADRHWQMNSPSLEGLNEQQSWWRVTCLYLPLNWFDSYAHVERYLHNTAPPTTRLTMDCNVML